MRGYLQGRLSFNVKGGRCEACSGDGTIKIEMNFLPDVYVPCEVCHGARYNRETLEVHYKGKSIAEVLDMPIEEAVEFFAAVPAIARHMKTLVEVGLGYVRLGQPATTLLGGEAKRVKLSAELQKRSTGKNALHSRRADHRPPLRGHPQAHRRALLAGRQGQHGAGDRAQPRRDQDRRLDHRHGSGGRQPRRHGDRRGHSRDRRRDPGSHTGGFLAPLLDGKAAEQPPDKPVKAKAEPTTAAKKTAAKKTAAKKSSPRKKVVTS